MRGFAKRAHYIIDGSKTPFIHRLAAAKLLVHVVAPAVFLAFDVFLQAVGVEVIVYVQAIDIVSADYLLCNLLQEVHNLGIAGVEVEFVPVVLHPFRMGDAHVQAVVRGDIVSADAQGINPGVDLHPAVMRHMHCQRQRVKAWIAPFGARQHRAPWQQFRWIKRIHIADYLEDEGIAAKLAQAFDLLDQANLLYYCMIIA